LLSEDDFEDTTNFRIERKLGPGVYYIGVSSYEEDESASFKLLVETRKL